MATITYPTSRTIACPLLIEATHFDSLDAIVDSHLPKMREYRNRIAEEEASRVTEERVARGLVKREQAETYHAERKKEEMDRYILRESRSVALYLASGREVEAERFSDAANQPLEENEKVVGFSMIISVGGVIGRVKIEPNRFSREMMVAAEPGDNQIAQSLYGALNNWARAIEAPKWQQKWADNKGLATFALFVCLLLGALFVPLTSWLNAPQDALKEEAHKLLASGNVNSSNELRTLTLLLAIESEYTPPDSPSWRLGITYWCYLALVILILLAVRIFPTVSIALWKDRRSVHNWRRWLRILTVGIPTLIVTSIVVPWILYFLRIAPPGR